MLSGKIGNVMGRWVNERYISRCDNACYLKAIVMTIITSGHLDKAMHYSPGLVSFPQFAVYLLLTDFSNQTFQSQESVTSLSYCSGQSTRGRGPLSVSVVKISLDIFSSVRNCHHNMVSLSRSKNYHPCIVLHVLERECGHIML